MSLLSNRIKKERKKLDLSREELANKLGVSYSAIAMYEQGNREPNDQIKSKLCEIFDCSMDYLTGRTNKRNPTIMPIDKEIIISALTQLVPFDTKHIEKKLREDIEKMFSDVPDESTETKKEIDKNIQGMGHSTNTGAIVLVYGTIPAGTPIECIEDIIDTEEIPADMLKGGKEYFGLRVKGDSMFPEYLDGDTLILLKQDTCENGDDCVVMVNGQDGTFKRVFKNENGIILQPLNNAYSPISYSNKEIEELPVKILGKVVELRRKK